MSIINFKRDLVICYFVHNGGVIIDDNNSNPHYFRWLIDLENDDLVVYLDLPFGGFSLLYLEKNNYYLDNNNNIHIKQSELLFEKDDTFIDRFAFDKGAKHLYSVKDKTASNIDIVTEELYYKDRCGYDHLYYSVPKTIIGKSVYYKDLFPQIKIRE